MLALEFHKMPSLNKNELLQFSRQICLPDFGEEAQLKLKNSSVLVVGLGGLGCSAALSLSSMGVGKLGFVDFDKIELSNLPRQVLYGPGDIGAKKVLAAKKRIQEVSPGVDIGVFDERFCAKNADALVEDFDLVVDCSDNFETRYLVNDVCVKLALCFVSAAVEGFKGQLSVLNMDLQNGYRGPTYRCLYPEPPEDSPNNCVQNGVLGALVGVLGNLQALEAVKVLTRVGETLNGRLFEIDGKSFAVNVYSFQRIEGQGEKSESVTASLNKVELGEGELELLSHEVDVLTLKSWLDSKKDFKFIDIREDWEREIVSLGGEVVLESEIENFMNGISTSTLVVMYCRSGRRSGEIAVELRTGSKFENLLHLKGGIVEWIKKIDPSLTRY